MADIFGMLEGLFDGRKDKTVVFDKVKVDRVIDRLHIQPVGSGYIDMICPSKNIKAFIDEMDALNVRIYGFTWWCHVTGDHKPCGLGGPKNKFGDGWYSEVFQLGDIILMQSNDEVRDYLLNVYPNSEDYKPCHNPGFWLEPGKCVECYIKPDIKVK